MSKWQDIIGHEWAVEVLANAITHDNIGHAYLITGSAQIGKTTLARTFAMALNCTEPNSPCGLCRSCTLIAAGKHPDVQLIEPDVSARGKQSLKIEKMRDLQRQLQLASYEGKYKIAIVRNFEAATIGAANAFLKTLEEPPKNVILILTATDADGLLDTIKSRCRVIGIRPIPIAQIEQALVTRWAVPQAQATLLAHLTNGRLGWAVTAATDPTLMEQRNASLAVLNDTLAANRVDRFKLADKISRKPEALGNLLNIWVSWWRDLTLTAHGRTQDSAITNVDEQSQLTALAQQWDEAHILESLKQTTDALWQIDRNANVRLVLENLFLTYPQK